MSEICIDCGDDTAWGSGKYVNRVPADNGYVCAECLSLQCDRCGDMIEIDCDIRHGDRVYCDICADDMGVTT